MKPMTVTQVSRAIGIDPVDADTSDGVPTPDEAPVTVTSVDFDTRRIVPGALFVALRGDRVDGHDLITAAAQAGAVAALVDHPVPSPIPLVIAPEILDASVHHDGQDNTGQDNTGQDNTAVLRALASLAHASITALPGTTVIGITGSAGKTSTKDMVAALCRAAAGPAPATIHPPESFNNELGHPYTVLRAVEETRYLVLELSARGPGHIAALAALAPPSIGVVLNVGTAHVGEFGSVEGIAVAKGELVEALPASGVAVLNADDFRVAAMASRTTARVVTVGTGPDADIRATDIVMDATARAAFTLVTPAGSAPVRLAVSGEHQIGNALAAAAVGLEIGMGPERIAEVLGAAGPASKWRMDVTERADG